jgi:siroheme synthase-like protein
MTHLVPLFMNLNGRRVVLVGAGRVAAAKLTQLLAARADVFVVAPEVHPDFERAGVAIARREFVASVLDGAWLVVAAAPPPVNRAVAVAAEMRRVFVNAVDDPSNATAFFSGVVRRDGVTLAISTSGDAPGLTALVREALDAVLPCDLGVWMREARRQRSAWRRDRVPMAARRPLLLEALNRLYEKGRPEDLNRDRLSATARDVAQDSTVATDVAQDSTVATDAAQDSTVATGVALNLSLATREEAR